MLNNRGLIKSNFKSIFIMTFFTIINTFLIFLIPISISYLLSSIKRYNIYMLFGGFLCLGIISLLIKIFINYLKKRYSVYFKTNLNLDLYNALFRVKYNILNGKSMVYFIENITTAVNNINIFMAQMLPNLISTILILTISFVIIAYYSIFVSLFLLVLIFLEFFVFKYINKRLSEKSITLQDVCAKNFSYILSVVDNLDYFKSYGSFKIFKKLLKGSVKRIHHINEDVCNYAANMSNIFSMFINFSQYFLFLYFGYATLTNNLQLSNYIFLSIVINLFFGSLSNVSNISVKYSETAASWAFINEEIFKNVESDSGESIGEINKISFKNTNLVYDNLDLVLNINLEAKKGDIVFIKGETGCGKSTLLKSLLGFNKVNGVYLNDNELESYNIYEVRNKIGYISQNFSLINDTILNNVLFGRENTNEIKFDYKFFNKFMENKEIINSEVQNKGGNLSGGDKQKIVLSRMLLDEYNILILDEVTSSMDENTEQLVFDEIISRRNENIIFIISHNTKLQSYANKLWEFKDNQILELKPL